MEALTPHFSAWRIIRAGEREVVEALIPPEHRAPSPSLAAALAAWPHVHYWGRSDHSELVLVRPTAPPRRERWLLHLALLLVTILSALGAGAVLSGRYPSVRVYHYTDLLLPSLRFFPDFLRSSAGEILSGWDFAIPLLGILLIHELGHYVAARRYAIDASLPYFLPVPPTLSPIGSLGAFLKLRSPVVDRRQLLDVGAAGPLAGFVVVLGVLAWGYATSTSAASINPATFVPWGNGQLALGDSILTHAFREWFLPGVTSVRLSLPAFAGWAGALITGLNLLPLSQLDGGHVAYGLLGRRQTQLGLLTLLALLWLAQAWTAWLIWVVLTLVVGGGRWTHPSVLCPERPVPPGRRVIGWLCVLVFILTFVPVPFAG